MLSKTPTVANGFSLVEVLIALLIFSVGLLSSGVMALKSLSVARDGLYHTQATDLAQMQQESFVAYGLSEVPAWQKRVSQTLPQGQGLIISHTASNGDLTGITIEVYWEPRYKTSGVPHPPIRLFCRHAP